MTINAAGGNDTITLSNVPLNNATVINGDAGDDIIVGSGAAEVINGGAGADRITGFDGDDTVNGGTENDVMQWNNGDDNDINNGGDGNDDTLITAGAADDNMVVEPNGQSTRFRRVNGPFTVDMADRRAARDHVLLGQRHAHPGGRDHAPDERRRRLGRRQHHDRRRG